MQVYVFEDEGASRLYPLTLTRPVFELKCGATSLLEKIKRSLPHAEIHLYIRDYLAPVFKNKLALPVNDLSKIGNGDALFINGRWLVGKEEINSEGPEEVAMSPNQEIVYARVKGETLGRLWRPAEGGQALEALKGQDLPQILESLKSTLKGRQIDARMVRYPWDLIKHNSQVLTEDFAASTKKGAGAEIPHHLAILGPKENLYIAPTAKIFPFVLLDATQGPIYIDEEVSIASHTSVEGPAYIGPGTKIVGAKIRPGCSIGPVCRLGGELDQTIIHGLSNKYHLGFIGHSYLGEWINLGALTTNSDLKNDYSTVEVWLNGRLVNTGELKVGSFIGDHTKLGIGTLLNTGTSVGVCCNILPHGELLPKFFPSFTWFFRNKFSRGMGLENMLKTARVVMARRDVELTPEEIAVLQKVYGLTEEEREKALKRRGR
ncbi:MAG: hypothetical protein AMS15_01620 [Planctomycetes bacterium DG_23]|nr:MAG: hypothetical protein AMS15_01620 [Planctomycetes bacterium DG_23]